MEIGALCNTRLRGRLGDKGYSPLLERNRSILSGIG